MTGPSPGTGSLSPTARQLWRRIRGPLLILAVLLIAGVTIAALRSGDRYGALDPRSADRFGSRAVAELLEQHGVTTRTVTALGDATAATGPDTTLLVTEPDLLTDRQHRSLRTAIDATAGRTVLVAPGTPATTALVDGVRTADPVPVENRAPGCALAAARTAGSADLGGHRYDTDLPGADRCYPAGGVPTLVRADSAGGGDTVLLGAPDILYNDLLDENGNAALALQLLGSRPHLVWYLPSPADGSTGGNGERTFFELIPAGWLWGALQLLIAAVLAALWRARRLGPLVREKLPVAVRASETTEGQARLYHQANARDRAASALRTATRARISPLLGIAPTDAHNPEALLPAVTIRTGTGEPALAALLFGPPPADDSALIRLADRLDALEREVRTP
jgi:hypothetical protein